MLKKKFTSLVLALSITTATALSLSVNAAAEHKIISVSDALPGYEKISGCGWLATDDSGYQEVYMKKNEYSTQVSIHDTIFWGDYFLFTLNDESDIEEITYAIKQYDSSAKISENSIDKEGYMVKFPSNGNDIFYRKISYEAANDLYEIVADKVESCEMIKGVRGYLTRYTDYMTGYDFKYSKVPFDEALAEFQEYVASEKINAAVINSRDDDITEYNLELINNKSSDSAIFVVPNEELTLAEHVKLANKIYNDLGYAPFTITLEPPIPPFGGEVIDLKNAVFGDANNDSEITIADATLILQALGNPDKYSLSAQGEYNADVYGNGDGITPMDAIAIQQYDARIIKSF